MGQRTFVEWAIEVDRFGRGWSAGGAQNGVNPGRRERDLRRLSHEVLPVGGYGVVELVGTLGAKAFFGKLRPSGLAEVVAITC